MRLTTLCYLERDGAYLMLHRVRKKVDPNKGKWIGVGGGLEPDETPEECAVREVREETGYTMLSWRCRGLVTFVSDLWETEYMHLFTCDRFTGEEHPCDEGELAWVPKEKVPELPSWEGDRTFLRLFQLDRPYFSLKLVYQGDALREAALDGVPLSLADYAGNGGEPDGSAG